MYFVHVLSWAVVHVFKLGRDWDAPGRQGGTPASSTVNKGCIRASLAEAAFFPFFGLGNNDNTK
jgi:hypothetical protein